MIVLLALAVLTTPPEQSQCLGRCDVSTPERIAMTYHALSGNTKMRGKRKCIRKPGAFSNLIVVGHFAHDQSCRYLGVLDQCCLTEHPSRLAEKTLQQAGWAAADLKQRKHLAYRFVADVMLAYKGRIESDRAMPETTEVGKELHVVLWVRKPDGRKPSTQLNKYRFRFEAATGRLIRRETLESAVEKAPK